MPYPLSTLDKKFFLSLEQLRKSSLSQFTMQGLCHQNYYSTHVIGLAKFL